MLKCKFTDKYIDYEIRVGPYLKVVDFKCQEEEPLASGFCIFHDKDYLQDKTNYEEHKRKVLDRLKRKVNHAISKNESLLCIGFHLPDLTLSDLSISKEFTIPVYFNGSQFLGKVDFIGANFQGVADFDGANFQGVADFDGVNFQRLADFRVAHFQRLADFFRAHFQGRADFYRAYFQERVDFKEANFQGEATFSTAHFQGRNFQGRAEFSTANFQGEAEFKEAHFQGESYFQGEFNGETKFNYVLFEGKEKVIFDIENLSNVSFMNTEITGVRFSDKARWGGMKVEYNKFWGGKKVKEDIFKILDERLLEKEIKEKEKIQEEDNTEEIVEEEKDGHTKVFNLSSIKAVYRSLRENYEYRMRYDEAGQFFIREMELKRKYREVVSPKDDSFEVKVKQNNWFRRNLFSLTGLYYHLSRYGESIWRPTLAGMFIVFISTLFWLMQSNPTVEFSLFTTECNSNVISDDTKNNISRFIGLCEYGIRNNWLKAFERSLADFLPLLPTGDFKMGIIDFVIKIIGGAVTFGLIAVALRRRFERKYRH